MLNFLYYRLSQAMTATILLPESANVDLKVVCGGTHVEIFSVWFLTYTMTLIYASILSRKNFLWRFLIFLVFIGFQLVLVYAAAFMWFVKSCISPTSHSSSSSFSGESHSPPIFSKTLK